MTDITIAIEIFLKCISSIEILDGTVRYNDLQKAQFIKIAAPYIKNQSIDELESLYDVLKTKVKIADKKYRQDWSETGTVQPFGIYDLLFLANTYLLESDRNEIRCKYSYMLDWRKLTIKLSEDTFTTSFLAAEDLNKEVVRRFYDWPTVIGHNNFILNKLLQREMSDNHFHLWASSPYFGVSWISLMNNIDSAMFANGYERIDEFRQNTRIAYQSTYRESSLEVQHLQAALIRLYLYSDIFGKEIELCEYRIHSGKNGKMFNLIEEGILPEVLHVIQELQMDEGVVEEDENPFKSWKCIVDNHGEDDINNLRINACLYNLRKSGYQIEVKEDFYSAFADLINQQDWLVLKNIKPILHPDFYKRLWNECTENIVGLWLENENILLAHKQNIQNVINALKICAGNERDYVLGSMYQQGQAQNPVRRELCGERYFMYTMFARAYTFGSHSYSLKLNWFFAYLVLKESIRGELVQSNERYGFRNFQIYDRRKNLFIDRNDSGRILRLAIKDTLENEWIRNLEVRIVPRRTCRENVEYIRMIDRQGGMEEKEELDRYYYVYHFTKQEDDIQSLRSNDICRHTRKRVEIRDQALAIAEMREKYPMEAKRVLGIDGCSKEIGCRPEVFSKVFRYLKAHNVVESWKSREENQLPKLRATFHVGEDFLDIADGMRAIDEAIKFLGLEYGDRLGHALALGLDVKKYYDKHQNCVRLSKQDYLDNMAWLYHKVSEYNLEDKLENFSTYVSLEFKRYFEEVYGKCAREHNYNIRTYYDAWSLRGDDPECYITGRYVRPSNWWNMQKENKSYNNYAVNLSFPKDYSVREVENVAKLYHAYHYDAEVKMKGNEKEEFTYPYYWADGVELIQKEMQKEIAARGIAIETNPSSNYMISSLQGYEEHPIVKWYNYHLQNTWEEEAECPQLSVSINTDDKGCFSTSLLNEFSLMACALEHEKENGEFKYKQTMVYKWINEVRKMGNIQSFKERVSDE